MDYQQRFKLNQERAVITGGGRGIGLACAEALGGAGASLILIEPSEDLAAPGLKALTHK